MNVVIVESPAKAKTINKYLGPGFEVLASYGHVRDLPAKDGSVRPEDDFAMDWEADAKGAKRLADIIKAVKGSSKVILATDPDREGEAISWHVLQVLKDKKALKGQPVERVVFNAITKNSVLEAMKKPRAIDEALVDAYLARRALDYLVGFNLSPVLWRKLPGARSAGRVQSVALRLICDREHEIETFVKQEYWSILARLATPKGEEFDARVVGYQGKKLGRLDVKTGDEAGTIRAMLEKASISVAAIERKPVRRNPFPPFTTSTLQQSASYALGLSAARTMQLAQRLYEGAEIGGETVGLITYMRTDGVDIAPEGIASIRKVIGEDFGATYLPEAPRKYTAKAKNAQEAHEAIRPTDLSRRPKDVARFLEPEQAKLYDLIWKRTVASQMESAVLDRTTVDIAATHGAERCDLRATGSVVKFDGFLALYAEGRDDEEDEETKRLPAMAEADPLARRKITVDQHFTEPPPRFTEATLVKKMEELGIGRPSTYAATLQVLRDREYVTLDKRRLIPEDKGRLVIAFLESFFRRYVEYDFTADLEESLDKISAAEIDWKAVLRAFWAEFSAAIEQTKELRVADVLDALNDLLAAHVFPDRGDGSDPRSCPTCGTGRLSLKLGKFGSFIGCSNYPECRYTRQMQASGVDGDGSEGPGGDGTKVLGTDPATGLEVTLRSGRFGPYVQLGEGEKPKRSSLPKGWSAASIDLEKALRLLSLPREVGIHPETGKPITAGLGRFGPFVLHDGTYANLPSADEVFDVGINRAVTLIAEKKAGGRGRATPAALKELGEHPTLGGPVTVRDGRYGPYVAHEKVYATLPKGMDPQSVTMEIAVALVAEKAAKSPAKPTRAKAAPKKKAAAADGEAASETAAKKPAAKKPAAKKAAAKKPATRAAKSADGEG
ncbi:type I DNA topoisomerase [Pinisolibacter aquiterrae]|uniref:type I DNA topoisomerase n=1 Tax=Pinisolibacter aquiterrae TaxID=2815579 RepID=UPI001C3C82E1|nr:type I DNA topoisomerase [Pinisolibacter aquiterrae]MBV5263981.1 type I DNA topoisomerase [Pinisolibacter aquiterrae]MCC8233924.1 type I DNA topoisomerase [Pinisolibacter aquiterrae]